ncbi:CUE domain-containing protein 3 [Termitomyces sp. J132]|nr:CUE domain-containing protein 3 [Termitomyces sp. J132]
MLQSLESSPPDKSTRRKDAGALKILIRSSGIAPGIDNRGDGGRLRSTQGLVDTTSRKGKGKATQPTLVAPSLATSSLGSTSSVPDIDIKITQVLDIFPDHAPNYVRALLEYATFGGDPEKVVMALLDGSAPSSEDLESMAAATAISDADDVGRFVNERKNVFDDEIMDVSKLRVGKAKEDASHVLRDRSFIEQMKADILRRAEAISDEEEEEVFPSSKPRGADYAFDEEEDTGPSGIKVAGDGEESNDSETDNDDVQDMQTNWTDEQIEGWRIMLDKNPRKDRILQKHEFAGNHHETPLVTIASSSGGPLGGVRGRGGGGGGKGRSGTGSRGGRGGSTGGGADSARERAWKDKNKASRANHNRKKGHDKKMARAGAVAPPS